MELHTVTFKVNSTEQLPTSREVMVQSTTCVCCDSWTKSIQCCI